MNRKIFNKSDKSRIKSDLVFEPYRWWLRSADSSHSYYVGRIRDFGHVYNNFTDFTYGVLPICMI